MKGKNKDLLKEAIADAKSVRDTALQNAKIALEEAFTPKLQSMLSARLQKEVEDSEEIEEDEDLDIDIEPVEEDEDLDIGIEPVEEDEDLDIDIEPVEEDEELDIDIEPVEEDEELDIDIEDDDIETEGFKFDKFGKRIKEDEEPVEDETLDLESIIRELEDEEDLDINIEEDEDLEDVDIEVEGFKLDKFGKRIKEDEEVGIEDDEEVDITMEELYRTLREMNDEDETDIVTEPVTNEADEIASLEQEKAELEQELGEAIKVIKFMKSKLNEVSLINAKLLFTNKLFKAYNLTPADKVKVVETLDRAHSTREAKLVFVTLAESYNKATVKPVNKAVRKLTENIARSSKAQHTTRPADTILNEGDALVSRFQKLANIKKQ